jgi:hypothetical protein
MKLPLFRRGTIISRKKYKADTQAIGGFPQDLLQWAHTCGENHTTPKYLWFSLSLGV